MTTIIHPTERQLEQRAASIAGLRALADLLEQVPELPAPRTDNIEWCVRGGDEEAVPVIEAAAAALTAAGVEHTLIDGYSLQLTVPLAGLKVRVFHVYDQRMVEYEARTSYNQVIQLDAQAGSPS